ncbi:MAG: peptidoglycan-associated lipoprotein Pal [Burkholderiaceae bacterium]|nr:MAG: peptidoglycan-associated lipoprotein Pal [Burkholderiaceae bacterium]
MLNLNALNKTALLALIGLALAACSNVPLNEPKAKIEDRSSGNNSTSANDQTKVAPVSAADPLMDANSPLATRSIYFDYDSFVIKSEFNATINAHAKYLTANPGRKIAIEGNTDERGSREYNLALGQKRAEAVRKALAALGVAEGQMEAVSFGEEKPRAQGNDEAAWKENRRADINYK